jgi:hypothetical protein
MAIFGMVGVPFIYTMVGMFLGFILGARAARNQFDLQRKREEERDAARAARAAKKSATPEKS